jgi:hypothetical protein
MEIIKLTGNLPEDLNTMNRAMGELQTAMELLESVFGTSPREPTTQRGGSVPRNGQAARRNGRLRPLFEVSFTTKEREEGKEEREDIGDDEPLQDSVWTNYVRQARVAPHLTGFGDNSKYRIDPDVIHDLKFLAVEGLSTTKMINSILRAFIQTYRDEMCDIGTMDDFYRLDLQ